MPLRPIDAIFVDPERRLYVIYFRGELWQLPRMKIDSAAWQRRQPYHGDAHSLYLRRSQSIPDPKLAQQLRTLNLPAAVQGSTLPKFELWWEVHGFKWLKDLLNDGQSPLASHQADSNNQPLQSSVSSTANDQSAPKANSSSSNPSTHKQSTSDSHNKGIHHDGTLRSLNADEQVEHTDVTGGTDDIFAAMLTDLTKEVLGQRR